MVNKHEGTRCLPNQFKVDGKRLKNMKSELCLSPSFSAPVIVNDFAEKFFVVTAFLAMA